MTITRVLHYGMSSTLGGIETFIMNVYRNIDRSTIQFDFITFEENIVFEKEILSLGGKIYKMIPRKKNLLKNYIEINNFFKEHPEYKKIHFHLNTCSYITPIIAATKNYNRDIIIHSHSAWQGSNFRIKLFHFFNRRRVIRKSDYLIACSTEAAVYMYGSNIKKYELIPNAINVEKFKFNHKIRKTIRVNLNIENKFVFGHVGRLSFPKNHLFLLDIYLEIYKTRKDVVLLLIGAGELENDIREKVIKYGLYDSVIMLGAREDISDLMQAMDFFIFPSYFEGFPITLIEAQASGLPCLMSDSISSEVMITDNINMESLNNSANAWAERIMNSLHIPSREGRDNILIDSKFSMENLVAKLTEIYLAE